MSTHGIWYPKYVLELIPKRQQGMTTHTIINAKEEKCRERIEFLLAAYVWSRIRGTVHSWWMGKERSVWVLIDHQDWDFCEG